MDKVPFQFVLECLSRIKPRIRPMFGCYGVYAGEKIVLALRRRKDFQEDNGVWIATSPQHHSSLRRDFPSMRSIALFGKSITSWQLLPESADDFEEAVITLCDLILKGDSRIGKVPKPRKKKNPASR